MRTIYWFQTSAATERVANMMSPAQGFLRFCLGAAVVAWLALPGTASAVELIEPPTLAEQVKSGALPPVSQRVPEEPLVVHFDRPGLTPGHYGGTLRQLMERAKDIRRMSAFGYARLIGYNEQYELEPNILKSFEVEDGREFTFVLRRGHRWSDGHPFTTEDLRYFWEDMALNKELSPEGPPREMLVDGRPPKVEVIDEVTIRYTWDEPNPFFLPALAAATPLYIYRPAHYMKRFHKKYADPEKLAAQIAKRKRRDWVDLHYNRDRLYRLDNPDLPTLDPWVNTTRSPSDRFIFRRNPYFHWIDEEGHQLPYIDRVAITIADGNLIPAKVGAGEVDLQSRALQLYNYTILKRAEKRHNYQVRLWQSGNGSQVAIYPNLNVGDPVWRKLMYDVRFRRALSLAVDRHEINQVIYYGLARESADTMLPESPLFEPRLQHMWSVYDPKRANALLDEMGLTKRDARGVRLLPDGRPLELVVVTSGEGTEQSDVLELIRDTWAGVGVKLFIKPQTREVMRRRVMTGSATMTVFYGMNDAIANAGFAPTELAPTGSDQLNWPQWGLYYLSGGKMGEAPDLPPVQRLAELCDEWAVVPDRAHKRAIWKEMLDINANEVFSIGTVNAVPQPIVVSNRLHNVPETAIYAWDPGGHFGVYRTPTFWFSPEREGS